MVAYRSRNQFQSFVPELYEQFPAAISIIPIIATLLKWFLAETQSLKNKSTEKIIIIMK